MKILLTLLLSLSLKEAKTSGYLFFFVHAGCQYCNMSIPVIRECANRGYRVVVIVNDSSEVRYFASKLPNIAVKVNEGEANYLQINAVPTIVYYMPKYDVAYILANHYVTAEEIEDALKSINTPKDNVLTQKQTEPQNARRRKNPMKIVEPN